MSASSVIKLYDITSTLTPKAWSPNVWRSRFVLNYKRLPYETEWVHYPDIPSICSESKIPPTNTSEILQYTVPAIIDREHRVSDSRRIADYLEETYPAYPIYQGTRKEQMDEWLETIQALRKAIVPMVVPGVMNVLPEERDKEYFMKSRRKIFGMSLEEMFPPHKQGEIWTGLQRSLSELALFIDRIPDRNPSSGWQFGTDTPSYADFVLCSMFMWFRCVGPDSGWDRVQEWNGGRWERLWKACEPYMQVQ